MKTCLLCDKKLGFTKFKSLDGFVCKSCYEVVSKRFTQIIRDKSKVELLSIYQQERKKYQSVNFELSRKIGQVLLIDDTNQQICFPNHRQFSQVERGPEYYPFKSVISARLIENEIQDDKQKLASLFIEVELLDSAPKIIPLVSTPIGQSNAGYQMMKALGLDLRANLLQLA